MNNIYFLKHSKTYPAFTFIEILVVVGLIALLGAVVAIAINPTKMYESAKVSETKNELNALYSAIDQYLIDNSGYPEGVSSIYKEVCKSGVPRSECESRGMISLDDLIPDYVVDIPISPDVEDDSLGTGYEVKVKGSNQRTAMIDGIFIPTDQTPITVNDEDIIVVGSGQTYTTITSAMNSITDSSATKSYTIFVMPGTYNESIDIKEYVEVRGSGVGKTVLLNNAYMSNSSSIRDLTIKRSGNISWWAPIDAYSRRAANPCYVKNVNIEIDTNTGPIYPLLTRTGSFMIANNVTVNAKQPPAGDGLYAITHNAGGGRFYNMNITLEVKSGSGTRDDVGIVNTFWASNFSMYDSDITITNNATSNNTIDKIIYTNSAAQTRIYDSVINYTSATKSVGLFYPVSSGNTMLIDNVVANLSVTGSGTTTYGFYGIINSSSITDSTININKSSDGTVYGVRINKTPVSVTNTSVNIENIDSSPTSYALYVETSSPSISGSDFTATGVGTTYGGYITNVTCNPTISNTDFFGTTTGLYLNSGCTPNLTNVTYNSLVDL